jgi:protein-S-isoprenylcysteine O-methyltransferase Ste14
MSSTASPAESAATFRAASWFHDFRAQIVRRRIAASIVIFGSVIAADIFLLGILPRDVFNLTDPFVVLGLVSLLIGLATRSWSAGVLHKVSRLSTDGPYSLVRNPLYFGSFLMMFGFGLLIDDWWSAPIILVVVGFIYAVQIRFEERALLHIYGEQWTNYAATTPRMVPRLALPTRGGWSYKQWLHNREWQAIAASALAIVALRGWLVMFA